MYKEIAQKIADASNNHALTFFVGAGVSACSGIPLWRDLIIKICERMGRTVAPNPRFSSDEYLSIPQMFYSSLADKEEYTELVKSVLFKNDVVPNVIHNMLFSFKPVSFLTTNYDSLLETAAAQCCQSFKCVSEDEEAPKIHGDKYILKVHGDIEHGNFVLKEEDYLGYEDNFKLVSTIMRSVFATNIVVFIGYSLSDYNVKLILDWVKRVLRGKFRAVFLQIDIEKPLPPEELRYYDDRGFDVVELYRITTAEERLKFERSTDYTPRYIKILNYLKEQAKEKTLGNSDEESFELLFNKLKALDKLRSLRTADVLETLRGCSSITNDGGVFPLEGYEQLFAKYVKIAEMKEEEKEKLSKKTVSMFHLINRVFNKAGIDSIALVDRTVKVPLEKNTVIDLTCINLDFYEMEQYCSNASRGLLARSKRAFFLTRLYRFDEAYKAFIEIARDSFRSGDYVCYYIAGVNCIALRSITRDPFFQRYSGDAGENEESFFSWKDERQLFDSLPQSFRTVYEPIRELSSSEFLYRYGYEATIDAARIDESVRRHTYEWGLTSSGRASRKLAEYLRFLLGNGICLDVFVEYKTAVTRVLEKLVMKLVDGKLNDIPKATRAAGFNNDEIVFNQYDFYCFVSYFSAHKLVEVFKSYKCEIITFADMPAIEKSIINLLKYFDRVLRKNENTFIIQEFRSRVSTCLALTRFVELSEKTVEEICGYCFGISLNALRIEEVVSFLDAQVYCWKRTNQTIRKLIENALIDHLDKRINDFTTGRILDNDKVSLGVDYSFLALYIDVPNGHYISRRLCLRVKQIIDNRLVKMQEETVQCYSKYVSKSIYRSLKKWVVDTLVDDFNFDTYKLLVKLDRHAAKEMTPKLKAYLQAQCNPMRKAKTTGIKGVLPAISTQLPSVGYWCLCGILDKKDFMGFKGIEPEFDFCIDGCKFDYSLFDVQWLISAYDVALQRILKKKTVKKEVLQCVIKALREGTLKREDRNTLIKIMEQYLVEF